LPTPSPTAFDYFNNYLTKTLTFFSIFFVKLLAISGSIITASLDGFFSKKEQIGKLYALFITLCL
jgi:hypothetical protein